MSHPLPEDLGGLAPEEYARVLEILGRAPNPVELGIFAAMWSEHCSYKSSRKWLRSLPVEAPWVLQGPGENAGAVAIGEGLAAVFKMESHNPPLLHRAASGRGDGCRRHLARCVYHGRAAGGAAECAPLRRPRP